MGSIKCPEGQYEDGQRIAHIPRCWELLSQMSLSMCNARGQYGAVLRSALHGSIGAIHSSAVQYRSMKPSAVQCSTVQGIVVHFSAVQHNAIYCIALQFSEV